MSLGHPAGQTGVYRPVSQKFPVVYYRRTTIFAGTPAGCPRDTRPSRGFSENLCDFFLCAFFAPYKRWFEIRPESDFLHPLSTSIEPQFYLVFTSILPLLNLFLYLNLTSAQPAISNHGLETTVYRPLGGFEDVDL